jgi:molybdopterin converting factor small subunit
MVTVTIHYHNILRNRAGLECESLKLPEGADLRVAIRQLAGRHGPGLAEMLLSSSGEISPHLVIFVNQGLAFPGQQAPPLADGDVLKLFSAISGG